MLNSAHYNLHPVKISENIYTKHGKDIKWYWQKEFGYEINELTQAEAEHIFATTDVNTLRDRIAQARLAAGVQMDAPTADKAAEPIKKEFKPITLYLLTQNPKAILKTEKPTSPCRGLIVAQIYHPASQ